MDAFVINRVDGRDDGEDWTENYEELPGGSGVSLILQTPATFAIGAEQLPAHAGQVPVVPAQTPHTFRTGPDGYEACTSTPASGWAPSGWSSRHGLDQTASIVGRICSLTCSTQPTGSSLSCGAPTQILLTPSPA